MASTLRVRMYRTGFGDCFLVSFGSTRSARHILIDFGAHQRGEIGTMDAIMDNIAEVTKKKLAVVVATHAHRDHISGFGKFAERFADFTIDEVWMPWTEDPRDAEAAALQKKAIALYGRLENHLRLALGATDADPRFAAALNVLSNLRGNEKAKDALADGFGAGATPRYFKGGESVSPVASIPGLAAEILGPPRDTSFFSRMDPPADQRFLSQVNDPVSEVHPFRDLEMRPTDSEFADIVSEHQPVVPEDELGRLHELAEAPAERLALALDSVRNNTSLVILFRYKGKTLLFPGDAQWGNWQSWITADDAKKVLGDVHFFKVAHHGSENATPVDVIDALRPTGLAAMIPTQTEPFPTIPRKPLVTALERHCLGNTAVRSDSIQVAGAPKGPSVDPPKGFEAGELWFDYHA